jgi:hypothetical protein
MKVDMAKAPSIRLSKQRLGTRNDDQGELHPWICPGS